MNLFGDPIHAKQRYVSNGGREDEFAHAFRGYWHSREAFALALAEDRGMALKQQEWPGTHIDWTSAAEELFYTNYHAIDIAAYRGGGIYVFKNMPESQD